MNKKAFTVIELLVVVSIIAIFSTYAAINLNFKRGEREVERAAGLFYSTVLYARNLAASGVVFQDEDNPPDGESDVPNGYGVHIESTYYFIFGDLYASATVQEYDAGNSEQFENTTNLLSGIAADLYYCDPLASTLVSVPAPVDIFFETQFETVSFSSSVLPSAPLMAIHFRDTPGATADRYVVVTKNTNQIYVTENSPSCP